ncbi:hypothetical protein C3486_27625 [Streptomyces sp. Ru73]|uniref:hypothetical protein n=1 Tax=Streptomyces sp. Ru73 TaxID=2080748 RepID=UPI000CDD1157|nr:hypothetical protein [Streptomyces sp. Ru73]POX37563.1 hypothetical protein C3486_27625 [Streptomyces sp. Ru73]
MARSARNGLRARDTADFERLLEQALHTGAIARAVRADPTGGLARRLRSDALAEAVLIAEAAAPEYRTYLALREAAEGGSSADAEGLVSGEGADGGSDAAARRGRGLLPLFGVLVPGLAAASAVVFFLLGYLLRPAASQRALADALLTAGQVAVVVTAVSLACGVAGLLGTAARHRSGADDAPGERLRRAREDWQLALLQRGIVPHLERRLRSAPPAGRDAARPRLGYSSPDYAAPDYAAPDYASPDYASPDYAGPDFSGPDSGPRR